MSDITVKNKLEFFIFYFLLQNVKNSQTRFLIMTRLENSCDFFSMKFFSNKPLSRNKKKGKKHTKTMGKTPKTVIKSLS